MSLVKSVGSGFVARESQNAFRFRLVIADVVANDVVVVDAATGFDRPAPTTSRSNHCSTTGAVRSSTIRDEFDIVVVVSGGSRVVSVV
jgi:hypothetical protein